MGVTSPTQASLLPLHPQDLLTLLTFPARCSVPSDSPPCSVRTSCLVGDKDSRGHSRPRAAVTTRHPPGAGLPGPASAGCPVPGSQGRCPLSPPPGLSGTLSHVPPLGLPGTLSRVPPPGSAVATVTLGLWTHHSVSASVATRPPQVSLSPLCHWLRAALGGRGWPRDPESKQPGHMPRGGSVAFGAWRAASPRP